MPPKHSISPMRLYKLSTSPLSSTASTSWQISLKIPETESVKLEVCDRTRNSDISIKNARKAPIEILIHKINIS